MTERPVPSVRKLLADLHAYRLNTMAPADLRVNIDQRTEAETVIHAVRQLVSVPAPRSGASILTTSKSYSHTSIWSDLGQ